MTAAGRWAMVAVGLWLPPSVAWAKRCPPDAARIGDVSDAGAYAVVNSPYPAGVFGLFGFCCARNP